MKSYNVYDRILGCLVAAGMGDGIGAPSEAMSRTEIVERYGGRITEFLDGSDNRYALGNDLGEVTDDASQMYEMAKAVVKTGGNLTVEAAAKALVDWSEGYPKYYPRNAGPTTSLIIKDLKEGKDPVELGKIGKTYGRGVSNGAAMRIAAAGLCNPGDLDGAVKTAITMTKVTHGTQHAYSGACAIACGIAEAMTEDSDIYSVLKACIYGAEKGEEIGLKETRFATGPRVLPQIIKAIEIAVSTHSMEEAEIELEANIGNSVDIQPTVADAVGLFAAAKGDPCEAILGGANIGGDTDTIACVTGMLAGAYSGFSAIKPEWYEIFKKANPMLDFETVSKDLANIAQARMHK